MAKLRYGRGMSYCIASPQDFTPICQDSPDKIAISMLTLSGAERWSYAKLHQELAARATQIDPKQPYVLSDALDLSRPLDFGAALLAGADVHLTSNALGRPISSFAQSLPCEKQDRLFVLGNLDDPELLRQIQFAWQKGTTVLCASPKLTIAQLPILLRRHDVSMIVGACADLSDLLAANLSALPKLHSAFALDSVPPALSAAWQGQMGLSLSQI